jgi:hypothetical protein
MPTSGPHFSTSTQPQARTSPDEVRVKQCIRESTEQECFMPFEQ